MASYHGDTDSRFSENLRQLFVYAGEPTLRSCERVMSRRRQTVSAQRISDWRSGRHRPKDFTTVKPLLEWLTTQAVERGATEHLLSAEQWKVLWEETALNTDQSKATDASQPEKLVRPYVGLRELTAADSALYFGRSAVVADLEKVIGVAAQDRDTPLAIVTGPSGAGKSSLLGAGLATSNTVTLVHNQRPRDDLPVVADIMSSAPTNPGMSVLVIDQFEQAFAQQNMRPAAYVDKLITVAKTNNLVVVLGVRADFFDNCISISALAHAWQKNSLIVPAMNDAQLREIITFPARIAGCKVEAGLADLMIAEVHRTAGPHEAAGRLPLLAHVLQATWARRSNGRMTVSGYRATGGVEAAVTDAAERAWGAINESEQLAARNLLLALTYLGPDNRRVRSSLTLDDISERFSRTGHSVLEEFVKERLLIVADKQIEFVHDIILDVWPRLRRWIDEDHEAAAVRRDVETAAHGWADAGRPTDLLYSETSLALVNSTIKPDDHLLSAIAISFLDVSRHYLLRRTRVKQLTSALVTVVAIVAAAAACAALIQTRNLANERDIARFSSLMSQLPSLRVRDPALAAELTVIAHRKQPKNRTVIGNLISATETPLQSTLPGHTGAVYGIAYNREGNLLASAGEDRTVHLWRIHSGQPSRAGTVSGYSNFVTSVTFHPSAPILATGNGDGTVRFVDISDPTRPRALEPTLHPGHGTVYNVSFSPDGHLLAAPSDDGSVSLFDITDVSHPRPAGPVLTGHAGAVRTVAFSPNGRLLATGGDDKTTRLWDVSNPRLTTAPQAILSSLGSINHSVSFDSSGTRLAIAGDVVAAQIWNVKNPSQPRIVSDTLPSVTAKSWAITYGPHPGQLASAGLDGVIHVWNDSKYGQISAVDTLSAKSDVQPGAFSLQYSPDGKNLTAGYADGNVRIWHFSSKDFVNDNGSIGKLDSDFSGQLTAMTSNDGTLHLLGTDPRLSGPPELLTSTEINHRVNDSSSVTVSTDGKQVATANNNGGRVQIWVTTNPSAPYQASTLNLSTRYTDEIAYSPSRSILATGNTDTTVQIWDMRQPSKPQRSHRVLVGPTDLITGVAFNRKGQLLAVSSKDRYVRIYDLTRHDSAPVSTLATNTTAPAIFAHTSDTLITGATNGVALWDFTLPSKPRLLSSVEHPTATSFAISRDDRRLALGTADARLMVDDISVPDDPQPLTDSIVQQEKDIQASENTRWNMVFSGDGKNLIAAFTGTSKLLALSLDVNAAITSICSRIGMPPTRAEWESETEGVPFQKPCFA